jgi:hypothetical protein
MSWSFGLKNEAEKNETLSQYFQNVVKRYQSSFLDLRHPNFYKNHKIRVILLFLTIIVYHKSQLTKENKNKALILNLFKKSSY